MTTVFLNGGVYFDLKEQAEVLEGLDPMIARIDDDLAAFTALKPTVPDEVTVTERVPVSRPIHSNHARHRREILIRRQA